LLGRIECAKYSQTHAFLDLLKDSFYFAFELSRTIIYGKLKLSLVLPESLLFPYNLIMEPLHYFVPEITHLAHRRV
jgi:hypothetical protein